MQCSKRANVRPEFTLPDETATDRSLTELLSSGAIVLYFYPADFTPGCTRQACVLRDLHTEIQRAGLRVVGVSPQSPESHAKFRAKYNLPFVLAVGPAQGGHQDVWRQRPIGDRRAASLVPDRRRPPHSRRGAGGLHDWTTCGFRAQGDPAARRESSIVQSQHVGVADTRHRHDIHDAEVMFIDLGDIIPAA